MQTVRVTSDFDPVFELVMHARSIVVRLAPTPVLLSVCVLRCIATCVWLCVCCCKYTAIKAEALTLISLFCSATKSISSESGTDACPALPQFCACRASLTGSTAGQDSRIWMHSESCSHAQFAYFPSSFDDALRFFFGCDDGKRDSDNCRRVKLFWQGQWEIWNSFCASFCGIPRCHGCPDGVVCVGYWWLGNLRRAAQVTMLL